MNNQQAIDRLLKHMEWGWTEETAKAIELGIQALKENTWIPCSERLPEEPKENPVFDGKYLEVYLVTTKYGSNEQDKVYPFRAFWNGINFTDGWRILDVIAWMPLPEPYKGE
jgi:hypothetical protein